MRKVLFLGDMHLPFVHSASFKLALKIIKEWRPYAVIQVGDILDNRALKRHSDRPRVFTEHQLDVDTSRGLFRQLDNTCKAAGVVKKAITLGNHDTYMDRYLKEEAKALYDYGDLLDPVRMIGAVELGWSVAPYHTPLELGKVSVIHDVELCGPTAATRAAQVYGGSVVFGHTHAAAIVYTGDMTGERFVAMNVGWLGDPAFAEYMPGYKQARNWTHGVGYGYYTDDGLLFCNFSPFIRNKAVIDGVLYEL